MAQVENVTNNSFQSEIEEFVRDVKSQVKYDQLLKYNSEQILATCDDLLHLEVKNYNFQLMKSIFESICKMDVESGSGITRLVNVAIKATEHRQSMAQYLYEAHVQLTAEALFSASDPQKFSTKEPERKARFVVARQVLSKLKEAGMGLERTGEILARMGCCRETIVRFHNRNLTKAYLQTFPPCNVEDEYENDYTLRIVMKSADWRHLHIVISHFACTSLVALKLFELLMTFIPHYHKSKAGRDFLRGFLRMKIFNEDSVHLFELILMRASRESLEIFLKYDFRASIEAQCGIDILPCLFGNPDVDAVSLLKNVEIDLEARGSYDLTPLYFAVIGHATKNIQSLLDRGANMYALNEINRTPVREVIVAAKRSEECIKPFLLAGANPLSIKLGQHDSRYFFGIIGEVDKSECTNVIRLLAAHLAICEALGLSTEQHMRGFFSFGDSQLEGFLDDCRRQLKLMKSHEIRSRKLTMFTIVSEQADKFYRHIDDEDRLAIVAYVNEYREAKIFTYYCEVLEKRMEEVDEMTAYRNKAMSIISECMGINVEHLVIDRIMSFLSRKDLMVFKYKKCK